MNQTKDEMEPELTHGFLSESEARRRIQELIAAAEERVRKAHQWYYEKGAEEANKEYQKSLDVLYEKHKVDIAEAEERGRKEGLELRKNYTEFNEDVLKRELSTARQELIKELREKLQGLNTATGIGSIPETTEYANGWNDCRKRAFESKRQALKEVDDILKELDNH